MIRKSIPAIGTAIVTAAVVASVSMASGDSSHPASTPTTSPAQVTASAAIDDGAKLAETIAGTSSLPVAEAKLPASVFELLASTSPVNTTRAWRLTLPGDSRPAWLLAGGGEIKILVPRTLVGPDGKQLPDAVSTFGSTVADIAARGLTVSQEGGGQTARTIVLVPPGVDAPRLVRTGTSTSVREVPNAGRVYVAEPRAGEDLIAPTGKRYAGSDD